MRQFIITMDEVTQEATVDCNARTIGELEEMLASGLASAIHSMHSQGVSARSEDELALIFLNRVGRRVSELLDADYTVRIRHTTKGG